MEKLSGLRPVLIGLIVIHGIWLTMSAFSIVSNRVYEIIPPVVTSLLSVVGNGLEVVFYVLLLTILPALAKARD
jgi:hypothetical protein